MIVTFQMSERRRWQRRRGDLPRLDVHSNDKTNKQATETKGDRAQQEPLVDRNGLVCGLHALRMAGEPRPLVLALRVLGGHGAAERLLLPPSGSSRMVRCRAAPPRPYAAVALFDGLFPQKIRDLASNKRSLCFQYNTARSLNPASEPSPLLVNHIFCPVCNL